MCNKGPPPPPPLFSYLCPGLHDRNSRQDIGRRTVRQVLTSRLVIPLFQESVLHLLGFTCAEVLQSHLGRTFLKSYAVLRFSLICQCGKIQLFSFLSS